MKRLVCALTLTVGLATATAATAADVTARIDDGSLSFQGGNGFSNAVLLITGPGEFEREETASKGLPVFRAKNSSQMKDGLYQFSLTAASDEKVEIKQKNKIDNGRGEMARDFLMKPFSLYGAFFVVDGTIKPVDESDKGADADSE